MTRDKNLPAHFVEKLPTDGPYLDDINAAQEEAYRERRNNPPVADDEVVVEDTTEVQEDVPVIVQNENGEFVIQGDDDNE